MGKVFKFVVFVLIVSFVVTGKGGRYNDVSCKVQYMNEKITDLVNTIINFLSTLFRGGRELFV